jgi:hypothetical protein
MVNNIEDTNHYSGTLIFVILFSFFALIFSGKSESQTSASSRYSLQNEPVFGNMSIHSDATLLTAVNLPDLYKNCLNNQQNTSLNLFSLQCKIFNYNQRTTQNFINIQKTRLIIEPLVLWRLYIPFPLSEKEDLPVLS